MDDNNQNEPYDAENSTGNPINQNSCPPDYGYFNELFAIRRREKKFIRKFSNWSSAVLLIIFGFQLIFSFATGLFSSFVTIETTVYSYGIKYILFSAFSVLLPGIIVGKSLNEKMSDFVLFEKTDKISAFSLILMGFLAIGVGNFISEKIIMFFPKIIENYTSLIDQTPSPDNIYQLIVILLVEAAIPALFEEFVFRGVILGSLRKYGDIFAIMASSILFALMHSNFCQIPFTFILGFAFGFIAVKTNNIWCPVILHFANNASSIIISYIGNKTDLFDSINIDLIYYAFAIVIGIIGYIIYRLHNNERLFCGFKKYIGYVSNGTVYGVFFSSPCFIVSAILYLFIAYSYAI